VSATLGPVAGTDPYPWPYDAPITTTRLALVVCGWDEHWRSRVGPAEAETVTARVEALAAAVAAAGGAVIALAHTSCAEDAPRPLALDGALHLCAGGIDGYTGSPLEGVLRRHDRSHLLLAGHGLEAPVHSTLRSANDRGAECLLVADACSPLDPSLTAAALSTVTMSGGIFGAVGTLDSTLAALAAATTSGRTT
jgi:hypothetical protein